MPETTHRFGFPLLSAGQAQKELTHNEALVKADMLMHTVVQAIDPPAVPDAPEAGQCWIVGEQSSGPWAGQTGAIASWTAGGWRFAAPVEGMEVWSLADEMPARFLGGTWQIGRVQASSVRIGGERVVGPRHGAIPDPEGGASVDAQARQAIAMILGALRHHGLIAS